MNVFSEIETIGKGGKNCKEKLLQMKSIVVDFSGQMLTPAGGNKKFKTLAKLLDFLQKKSQNIMGGISCKYKALQYCHF